MYKIRDPQIPEIQTQAEAQRGADDGWGTGVQNLLGDSLFSLSTCLCVSYAPEQEVRQMYKYLHEIFTIRSPGGGGTTAI